MVCSCLLNLQWSVRTQGTALSSRLLVLLAHLMASAGLVKRMQSTTAWRQSPTPGVPVKVSMHFVWKQIHNIDEKLGVTDIDIRIKLRWKDARIARRWQAQLQHDGSYPADDLGGQILVGD